MACMIFVSVGAHPKPVVEVKDKTRQRQAYAYKIETVEGA